MKPKLLSFILSDDIRYEIGEKKSIIGIYTDVVFVPKIPFTMPKMGFFIRLSDLDFDRKYKLIFKITNINTGEDISIIEDPNFEIIKMESIFSDFNFVVSPIIFNSEGDYKVVLELTGEETYTFEYNFKVTIKLIKPRQ